MNIDELFYHKLKSYAKDPDNITWEDMAKRLDEELLLQQEKNIPKATSYFEKSTWIWIVAGLLVSLIVVGVFMLYRISKDTEEPQATKELLTTDVVVKDTLSKNNLHSVVSQPKTNSHVATAMVTPQTQADIANSSLVSPLPQFSEESIQSDAEEQEVGKQHTDVAKQSAIAVAGFADSCFYAHDKENVAIMSRKEEQAYEEESVPDETSISEEVFATLSSLEKEMETHLRIPNFISPNFDGKNDVFRIAGLEKFPKHELKIFTQRGAVLLHTKHYNQDWMAENVPDGVYFYILRVEKGAETAIRRGVIHVER